jgi:hypothetical protein
LSVDKIELFVVGLVLEIEGVGEAGIICKNGAGEEDAGSDEEEEGEEEKDVPKEVEEAVAFELVAEVGHA